MAIAQQFESGTRSNNASTYDCNMHVWPLIKCHSFTSRQCIPASGQRQDEMERAPCCVSSGGEP